MAYEIDEQPDAQAVLDKLAGDPAMYHVLDAIERALDRLSEDPFSRRLGNKTFQSEQLGNLTATPARTGDWWIIWRLADRPNALILVGVGELPT